MASLNEITDRMNRAEGRLARLEQPLSDHLAKFGYYWINEHIKATALICKIVDDKADLVVFYQGWSGGMDLIIESKLFILDPTIPSAEQLRTGKWEPAMDVSEIVKQVMLNAKIGRLADAETSTEGATAS